jgi:hypothetical protein
MESDQIEKAKYKLLVIFNESFNINIIPFTG